MNLQDFEHALNLGLGRTILHLQQHDAAPYREIILHACLHNTVFDPQMEGYKLRYLMDIIELTGEKEFYLQQILDAVQAIDDTTDDRDGMLLLGLTQAFAEQSNSEARQTLYDKFSKSLQTETIWGAAWIILLDELEGFLYIADKLGELALNDPEFTDDTYLLTIMEDILGETESEIALTEARRKNPNIDAYLKIVEPKHRKHRQRRRRKIRNLTYSEVKKLIEKGSTSGFSGWIPIANDEDIKQAAEDVIKKTDPELLRIYLKIFRVRTFPLNPQYLIKLTEHENFRISALAFTALKQLTHPTVRKFALERIEANQQVGDAVKLLDKNFQEGDWQIIEEVTQRQLDDEDNYHWLQMAVRDISKNHPSPDATNALINIYEKGPCSFCREFVVESLSSMGVLPDYIREECHHDSNSDIRELAANNFVPIEECED